MTHKEIIRELSGMLIVNEKERQAVSEAVAILKATDWRDAEYEPPEVDEDGYSEWVLLSFSNFPVPAIGNYRVDEDGGGAYYAGDEDKPLISYGLIVNAWCELPKPYREEEG